jgi:phosphatidylinositol glycan class S
VSNFTVDTQVQLYATFSPSVHAPEYDTEHGVWTLQEEDLSGFINAAEWPLSPSIGAGPTLNFVLYVPDQATSPLVVRGSQASSWLIPQWGGVVILNPQDANATSTESTLSKEAIQPALLTFSHQLLSFLGAPQTPPSLPLQLQTLTRIRAASLLLSASSTMGSLARLTVALPSIAIPETVSTAVDTTLSHLRHTCNALKEGKFTEALENARIAEAEAERGFFEKSMVGQVYFPDEHKVAVYLPLLGPIGVPLIMSALKELKRVWAVRRAQRPLN